MTTTPRLEAERHAERADVLMAARRPAEAAEAFAAAVRLRPDFASAHAGLGVALAMTGRMEPAAEAFRQAATLNPADAGAWSNLGKALQGLGRLEAAADALQKAAALNPDFPAAAFNLSAVLGLLGRSDEAVAACRRAVALKPDWPEAHAQLGNLMLEEGRLDESVAASRQAIRLAPGLTLAHNNLGIALFQKGELDEAEQALRRAVALAPDWPRSHHSLAFLLLKQGRLEEGWREYEWRWKLEQPPFPNQSPAPRWSGQPIAGKTLLVESEQGVGDTIQFIRFAALAAERGAKVVLQTAPSLVGLLGTAPGLSATVANSAPPPPADYRCAVISLPAHLGTRLETIPAAVPYLDCPQALVELWAERLGEGFKIGLVWQGNKLAKVDRARSIPLAAFAPLARLKATRLISLQKTYGLDQLDAPPPGLMVERLGPVYDDGDWSDTAAAIRGLDLVISCDTAVAHLAGALGRPVWLAVPKVAEWRWLTGRADSPWYPTMRLFHQPSAGDWEGAFEAMAAALERG